MTTTLDKPHARSERQLPQRRLAPLCGPAFVLAVLVGNSLTESVTASGGVLAEQAARAGSPAFRSGLVLELAGLVALAVFVAWAATLLRRAAGPTLAGTTALVAGILMLAVKLGSGTVLLAVVREHERIDEATAVGLLAANAVAFELFWVGFGLFLVAFAAGLRDAGLGGRSLTGAGIGLGVLTLGLGVVGAVVPAVAVPIPFLLGLLWVGVVGVRAAMRG